MQFIQFHSICQGSRLCISANTEDVPWPTLLYAKFHLRGFQAESAILYLPVPSSWPTSRSLHTEFVPEDAFCLPNDK